MSRRSGTLRLACPPHAGDIVFVEGRVVAGCIEPGTQTLGESLVEAGVIASNQYSFALVAEQQGTSLPELLTQFDMPPLLFEQICEGLLKRTILVMFQWKEGSFLFESQECINLWQGFRLEGHRHVVAGGLSPQYLALEGARLEDERREGIEGPLLAPAAQGITPLAELVRPLLEDTLTDFEDDAAPPTWGEAPQTHVLPQEYLFDPRQELLEGDSRQASGNQQKIAQNIDGEMATLRSMLAELKEAQSRDAIVLLVLRFAGLLFERAAIFMPRGELICGVGGFCSVDLPDYTGNLDNYMLQVRRVKIAQSSDSILRQVQLSRMLMSLPLVDNDTNRVLMKTLGGAWPTQRVVAAPLIAADQVALIILGDNPSGKHLGETDGLEIFLQQAGVSLERVTTKK